MTTIALGHFRTRAVSNSTGLSTCKHTRFVKKQRSRNKNPNTLSCPIYPASACIDGIFADSTMSESSSVALYQMYSSNWEKVSPFWSISISELKSLPRHFSEISRASLVP